MSDTTQPDFAKNLQSALAKRGYETVFAKTREEAAACVMREAVHYKSVGWGGSESIRALNLNEQLAANGIAIGTRETPCELFLLSANAITDDGRIVNIDGTGNRVAASIFGCKRVVYVIGRNKIVAGGVDDAIARIKREVCPKNARRLNRQTPCGLTGVCGDCDCADRMCNVIAIFERCPSHTPTLVILVDEELGY